MASLLFVLLFDECVFCAARNQRSSVKSLSHSVDGNRKNLSFQPEVPAKKSPTPIQTMDVDQTYMAQSESEDFTTEYTRKIDYQRNEGYEYVLQTFVAVFTKKWVLFKRTPLSSIALLVVPPLMILLATEVDYLMIPTGRQQSLLFSVNDIASSVSLLEVGPGVPESLVHAYKSQFSGTNEVITLAKNSDMVTELNAWAKNRLDRKFVVGAALRESPDVSVGYYHANALHSQGLTVQLMINAYVKFYLGEGYSLQSGVFHRMKQRFVPVPRNGFLALTVVMATLPGIFIYSPIADRAIGTKHLEFFTGLSPIAYWIGTFVFDLIVYTAVMTLVLGACWYLPFTLLSGDHWLVTPCLLMTYGLTILPYIYCVQLVFDVPSSGAVGIVLINFTLGIICHVLASYSEYNQNVALLDLIMTVLTPQYALESSLTHLADMKAPDNKDTFVDYRWLVGPGRDVTIPVIKMVCLLIQGALSWVILVCVEYGLLQKMKYKLGLSYTQITVEFEPGYGLKDNEDDYDDVLIESDRVDKTHLGLLKKQDVILMRQLQKLYLSDRCRLINGVEPISLGIRLYQCFGLLGQGGTGKTSLFKMLTGDVMISSGSAYIFGYNVRTEFKQIHPITGYCPQDNALNDLLTGRETLELYGQLKGIPADKLPTVVGHMLDLVGLRHDMDTLTKFYSKGTKRKLCVAIALIGNPFVVLLDEPTNGMDQTSKEATWSLLKMVKESGRTILLASQSLEEIERLCSRMSIMMRGKLMCLGGPDYLKDKYSMGYTLEIYCSAGDSSQVMLYVRDHLVGAGIFCHLKEYLCFLIPHCIALHQVFVSIQYAQRQIGFSSFTVHRSKLEQVFLMFVKDGTTFSKSSTCL